MAEVPKDIDRDAQLAHFTILNAPDAIFWVDKDGRCHRVNSVASQLLGYSSEEMEGMRVHIFCPSLPPEAWPDHWNLLKTGDLQSFESKLRSKAGELIPVQVSCKNFSFDGQDYVCAFVRDERERHRVRQTILSLERQNALILKAAGEGIVGLNVEGKTDFVNPAAATMLGYTPRELIGQYAHALWHHTKTDGSPYPKEECPIYKAYKGGHVHHGDTEVFWRKDGTCFPAEYSSTPMKNEEGTLVGAVVTFRDISERKAAERALNELRLHTDRILKAAGEGIFGLDLTGRHTFVNPAAAAMLGYTCQELIGQPSHSLWHHTKADGSPYPQEECPIYGAYKDGLVHQGVDEIFWRKDGKSFPAQYTSTPIRDDLGNLAGAVVTFQDITEKKRMAAQLLEEAKLAEVTRVLGDIGHDIKNMLMPVLSGADLLKEELDEQFPALIKEKAKGAETSYANSLDLIRMIVTNARRIQERVREIADAVKGVTSPPHFTPCRIEEIVDGVFETLRTYSAEKGITLLKDGLGDLPVIDADERRLFNALYNLINNAIPEVPRGGSITVSGSSGTHSDMVELVVADTGRGMPPEVRDRLFTPQAISTKKEGTGLGTKIVKDVVDLHHGRIRVESEIGKGSTFYILLPLYQKKNP
ncbi:MAG: PAS domain S-box protein [Nitrospirales bacterium]|nr:PAS domain S-box protein [Nitrospirales bacterium]